MKDKPKGNKGRGVGWLGIGTELRPDCNLNPSRYKIIEAKITVLKVATLEDNRSQVLKGKIEKASFEHC